MEKVRQEELKAHLIATNEQFRTLAEQHADYERLINEIEARVHVTPEDEFEEHRLKKLKLHLKDQMLEMMARASARNQPSRGRRASRGPAAGRVFASCIPPSVPGCAEPVRHYALSRHRGTRYAGCTADV